MIISPTLIDLPMLNHGTLDLDYNSYSSLKNLRQPGFSCMTSWVFSDGSCFLLCGESIIISTYFSDLMLSRKALPVFRSGHVSPPLKLL